MEEQHKWLHSRICHTNKRMTSLRVQHSTSCSLHCAAVSCPFCFGFPPHQHHHPLPSIQIPHAPPPHLSIYTLPTLRSSRQPTSSLLPSALSLSHPLPLLAHIFWCVSYPRRRYGWGCGKCVWHQCPWRSSSSQRWRRRVQVVRRGDRWWSQVVFRFEQVRYLLFPSLLV